MMLDFRQLIEQSKIKIKGVIQLGSHFFQEKEVFESLGVKEYVLVEPQKSAFNITKQRAEGLNAILYKCAVSDEEGVFEMLCDEVNQGQSSSLLPAKKHLEKYPDILFTRSEEVEVRKLDNLEFEREKYNVIVCDLQGNELKMLKGAIKTLNYIDAIYTEVNFIEMYEGCALINELDQYLKEYGFIRVATGENTNNQGWSDAFYIKIK